MSHLIAQRTATAGMGDLRRVLVPTHTFETEGEFYGEEFKIRVEYQHDLDGPTLVKIEAYREEPVAYGPDGRYQPHLRRHSADITTLLTESQRQELAREIVESLAQAE